MFGEQTFAQLRTGFRDAELRTATSTFTQLLISDLLFSSMLLFVHRDRIKDC